MRDFCTWVQLLFGKQYATYKMFRLDDYQKPKYGMESQGMDVFGDRYIIQGSDNTGSQPSLVVIDLNTKKIAGEFRLPFDGCHMNNINTGAKLNANAKFPMLYISECRNKRRCYVVSLTDNLSGYTLVQELYFNSKSHYGKSQYAFDWFVDGKYIYTFGMTGVDGEMEVCKFDLPSSRWTKRTLTDVDIIESFKIQGINTYQGTKVIDGKLYALSGLDTKECPTYLHVIDLKTHKVEKKINIAGLSELEAIGQYKDGFIVVNCAYNPTYTYLKLK